MAPLAAVMTLLAPAQARATSDSPDPAPGASVLAPDPAPTAAPVAKPAPVRVQRTAPALQPVAHAVVVAAPVRQAAAPAPKRAVPAPTVHKRPPVKKPHPHKVAQLVDRAFQLPPILVPKFIEPSESSRAPALLAALALGLAALTAGSGAGLVLSWSRR